MEAAGLLGKRLRLAFQWYRGMISPASGMFEYLYRPESAAFVREKSPIRDIASVWDAELLGDFLKRQELATVIRKSLQHYRDYLVERDGCLILDPARLREPSSIAHNAFMILALLHAAPPVAADRVAALAEGVLRQQRTDGSYKVYFHDLPDQGEELYAGEAMLALMETYRWSHEPRCLQSVQRAVSFYDTQYFARDLVGEPVLVFFANWQSQACRRLFERAPSVALKERVSDYVYRMHDQAIEQGLYESIAQHPDRQIGVKVACALEGLNDAYALATSSGNERAESYRRCIRTGVSYLLRLQCTRHGAGKERGGFGMSLADRAQRIDVTGHATSAFMKCLENGIDYPLDS